MNIRWDQQTLIETRVQNIPIIFPSYTNNQLKTQNVRTLNSNVKIAAKQPPHEYVHKWAHGQNGLVCKHKWR